MRLWGVLLLGVCASLPAGCTRSKEVRDGPEPGPPPLSSVEQYNYKVHHARTGDTLAAIGRTYGVPWRSIALVNDIPPPYRLAVGQVVLVPLHLRTTQGAAAPPRVRNETPSPPPQRPTSPQTVSVPRSALHRGKPNHAFWWPTSGTLARRYGDVTRGFDEPGIGIRAPAGTEVYAVAWGRVICTVRSDAGWGNVVVIRHAKGVVSWYGHLGRVMVRDGQEVGKAARIGTVGSSGAASAPELAFRMFTDERPYDPLKSLP